jgi:DNA polymerase delta subunit 1
MSQQRRTVKFKAGYWYHELIEKEHRAVIHIGGRTQQNETVHVIVENFKPTVFLELPKRIDWDRTKCKKLYEWLKEKMGLDGPTHYNLTQKYKLHYKVLVYCICLEFPTDDAARKLKSKLSYYRGIHVPSLGSFQQDELKVHEHNIDTVIQFTAKQLITLSSWVKVKETIHDDELDLSVEDRKYSSADIDLYANWSDVCSTTIQEGNTYVPPKYFSFDIECYSKNHNSKLPNPEIPENVVNQIALTIGILNDKERKRVILTLGNPEYIENSDEIRRHYYSEKNLLLDFKEQLLLYDPDIFLGYNITKFDWNYLIKRAELCGIYKEFSILSRIYGKQAELRTINWGSSAYGEQKFRYPECHGRTNVDVLIEVERNYRLPNYRLDTVANHFNIGSKDDLSARALFMIWQMTLEILPKIDGKEMTLGMCTKLKAQIAKIFTIRQCHGLIRDYRKKLLKCTKDNLCSTVKEGMSLMGKYCIQDTILPVDLAEKLNIWTSMEEMSNVTNVPVSYLHTRGQQIKVVAQVYRETSKKGFIIPFHKKVDEKEKFQGAMVVEANPGEYELVATLDFASLYPSIMMAFNICHTTILSDSDPTPDSECHVLIWSDHYACIHDPQKRKKKAADILCKDHRYRFRKVKYIIKEDGTITREHEGIFPRLERTMMGTRKLYKKDMAKAEAKVKMNDGEATAEDIAKYKEWKYDVIEKGSLSEYDAKMADVEFGVHNAKQLAVKISMNSAYGILGVENGFMPLIKGAASVTAMGRMLIMMAIDFIRKTYPFVKLVYGDTDSCMIHFEGKNLEEHFALIVEASKKTTHHLKCHITGVQDNYKVGSLQKPIADVKSMDPYFMTLTYEEQCHVLDYETSPINLEFENMYGWFLLLTKKRYMAEKFNKKGEVIGETLKGNVLTRRDNSKYLRDTYKLMKCKNVNEEECIRILCERITMLFTRQIPDVDLIIYMGIKSLINYAKSKKVDGKKDVKVFIDVNKDPIDDVLGPEDPRLVYSNIPQVLLALKMTRRGEEIPPNTRLEFLYLKNDNAKHQGEKAEDYTYYKENRKDEGLEPDRMHYIEKQLSKPVTELMNVRFPKPIIPYVTMESRLLQYIGVLTDLQRHRVANIKVHTRLRPVSIKSKKGEAYYIGWDALRMEGYKPKLSVFKGLSEDLKFKEYTFKSDDAKIAYMMDQMKYGTNSNDISAKKYPELLSFCTLWKSIDVIDMKYKEYGITRRKWRKPTYVGPKIRVGAEVVTTLDCGKIQKNTICKIISREDIGKGKQMYWKYDLMAIKGENKGEIIEKDVSRNVFTTFVVKNDNMMKNILHYREYYAEVVGQLSSIFKSSMYISIRSGESSSLC